MPPNGAVHSSYCTLRGFTAIRYNNYNIKSRNELEHANLTHGLKFKGSWTKISTRAAAPSRNERTLESIIVCSKTTNIKETSADKTEHIKL